MPFILTDSNLYSIFCVQVDALRSDRSVGPDDWATAVHLELKRNDGSVTYLTDLASYYLSNLVIACKAQFVRNLVTDILSCRFSQKSGR
jgi:hypothetical protein